METVTFWVVALILSSDPNKIAYDNPQHYEKASDVVFYKSYSVEPNPHNPDDDGQRRVARGYAGFNADQVDGFDVPGAPADDLGPIERCKLADAFVQATGAKIEHGGQRAFYRHSTDHIQMPSEGLFEGTSTSNRDESYYATLLHELTHWTAPEKRCNRELGKRFGDSSYAMEELVAEIGAALCCAELGISQGSEPRPDHAKYLVNWLEVLKKDCKAIFTASAKASEALFYLKQMQPKNEAEPLPMAA